ncbi:MAG: NAD(P)-dependent oxidoreductase [Pseudomonadota bacterium]|nr:NAD(P)-dependent oxidoreductase [Pseudomonadota bacterium]
MPATRPDSNDRLSCFPVFMKVEDRFAVVVGDGAEALAKARLLRESRIGIRVISPTPSLELGVLLIQADIDHVAAPFAPSLVDGAALVFAATGEAERDGQIVSAARERNIPVNAVDRPELCDFYVPALVNRAPVAIAIGSEGAGPVLTQMLRSRIETLLPSSTGRLARLARRYRAVAERLVERGAPRRRFWRAFFDGPVARCVEAGDMAGARRHATRLLKDREGSVSGHVSLVEAGPGAPDLLTLRAQRALLEADTILHAPGISPGIVALGRRDAERAAVEPADAAERLIGEAAAGRRVVLLASGETTRFRNVAATLLATGITHEFVPGVAASSHASARQIIAA